MEANGEGPWDKLSLGISSFAALRKEGQIYVDKTGCIYKLASRRGKFFLTRPRRFGKSLLISTFESLFRYGLRDFKGLNIEKLWKDEEQYRLSAWIFPELSQILLSRCSESIATTICLPSSKRLASAEIMKTTFRINLISFFPIFRILHWLY